MLWLLTNCIIWSPGPEGKSRSQALAHFTHLSCCPRVRGSNRDKPTLSYLDVFKVGFKWAVIGFSLDRTPN